MTKLEIATPEWAIPFFEPRRYKGIKGGRTSGKSHFFAEMVIETMIMRPETDIVCLREIQKSLRLSAKKLIEGKIQTFGAGQLFRVLETEIRRVGPSGKLLGQIIFQGMQDHTAESIKSLEGFDIAWFEEASRVSQRSLDLLRPTLREEGSELWFSWNPDQPTDPIEKFLVENPPDDSLVVHINFEQNPFCPEVAKKEAQLWHKLNPDSYGHVWLGDYNTKSDDQVLGGKWNVEAFEIKPEWDGPYYGADWGFSTDPNTVIEVYVDTEANRLYVRREIWGLGVEIEDTPRFFQRMAGAERYVIRADNARPEVISYMQRHGYRKMKAAEKWPGSIEDGISKLRSYNDIVVHPDCPRTAEECRLYKYKRDRLTDEILPDIVDKWNHCIDALRYAIEPLTKRKQASFWD